MTNPDYEMHLRPEEDYEMHFDDAGLKPEQMATVTPGYETQTVTPDPGCVFSEVTVEAIPEPTEEIDITENGVVDVARYGTANVNVPQGVFPSGTKLITQNVTGEDVKDYAAVDVAVPEYDDGGWGREVGAPNLDLLRQPGCELAHGSGYNVVFVSIKIETQLPSNYNGRFSGGTPTSAKEVTIQNDGSYTIVKDNVLNGQYIDMSIFSPGWHVLRFEYNYSATELDFYFDNGYAPLPGSIVEVYSHCPSLGQVSAGQHIVMIDSAPTSGLIFHQNATHFEFDNCDFSKATSVNLAGNFQKVDLRGYDFSSATSIRFGDPFVVDLRGCDFSAVKSLNKFFNGARKLRYLNMSGAIFHSLVSSDSVLQYCYALQEADLRFDLCGSDFYINLSYQVGRLLFDSNCQVGKISMTSCGSLQELVGFPHANDNVTIGANRLTVESLMTVIIALNTVTETKTINIGATNIAKLTADQIAIAQDKGWTVT